jgi:hypothetical protein
VSTELPAVVTSVDLQSYAPAGASPPVFALFQQALAKGAEGAGAMETLYKLYSAEREHSARLGFARAMSEFQRTCPPVQRTSAAKIVTKGGAEFGYKYADFEQIAETIGPHLRDNGLSYAFDSDAAGDKLKVMVRLSHVDGHTETSSFTLPTATASAMSAQQAVGAALTFAKRQCLVSVLGLALSDPDPEGQADRTPITESQAADLEALMDEVKAQPSKVLEWLGVAEVREIPAKDFSRVVAALEARRKAK